jgi:hypothetical protein
MTCTSVSGWEAFAWNDEGDGVRAQIEENLGHYVQGKKGRLAKGIVREPYNTEYARQDGEAPDLDRPSTKVVDCQNAEPVPKDCAGTYRNQVPNSSVVEDLINI